VQGSKLNLSAEEAEAVNDCSFFLLKHSATRKIMDLFGEMEVQYKNRFQQYGVEHEGLNVSAGKIFRGENYQLYPYILLDYPRLFTSADIFAFRTMFWWGHEFSYTLHLQGAAFEKYRESLFKNLHSVEDTEVYYCVNDTPWQYHFGESNYRMLDNKITRDEFFAKPFVKLSRKLKSDRYEDAAEYGYESFELLMGLLRNR
jgi:hypothetical protein